VEKERKALIKAFKSPLAKYLAYYNKVFVTYVTYKIFYFIIPKVA